MASSPPVHGILNDRQSRLSITQIDDRTVNTTSTTTTTPLTQVSRLDSADAANSTAVNPIVEIGTNGLVGGVVNLGSFKGTLNRQATSCKLLGLVTGKKQSATPGATTTWNYFDLSAAQFDYVRHLADQNGNVFAAWIAMDALLAKAKWDTKNTGGAMESYDVVGAHLAYINGYAISKAYVVLAGDVTAGFAPMSSTFFGALNTATAGAEIPKRVSPPTAAGQPPSALYSSGRVNFLKIARVLSANATIGGIAYSTGNIVRYRENQDYTVTAAGLGTIGAQTAVTTTVGGTNWAGPELVVGASIVVDPGGANVETCTITAVGTNTITFTTTKTHPTTGITVALVPTSGFAVYNPFNGSVTLGDTLVAGDTLRVLFASNDTSSVPKTIPTTSQDTTDVAGVPGRLTPITIAAFQIPRVQSASIDVSIARKEVQGAGEDEVKYGTAGVPAIAYSLSAIASDNTLLAKLSTGSGSTDAIYSPDYMVRYMNTNANAFTIQVKSPTQNQKVLYSITGAQPVLNFDDKGAANSETTTSLSGSDMSGTVTISATT